MTTPMLPQALATALGQPTDQRLGTVSAVTPRGIDVSVGTGTVEGAAHLTSYNPAVGDTVIMARYADSWTVLGRLVGPGTPTDNLSPGTGIGLPLLDGMVLTQAGGAMATSTGTLTTVPRYGVSFYHPVNHWVLLLLSYTWFCTVSTDILQVSVYETVSGTTFWQADHPQVPGASRFETYAILAPPTFGGAARNYGLKVQRTAGSGTSQIEDHASRRGSMFAYDAGASSIIRTV